MNLKLYFTIAAAKMVMKACRLVKLGGTSLPGEIARKLYPGVVKDITKGFKTIMVTGTNGKTTTTRIIGQILAENNIPYISNKSGANLVDGITTTFIEAVDLKGESRIKTALIEIDEAAFGKMADHHSPDVLVVTNFFRDQLDRYGELYTTLKKVRSGIEKSHKTHLVLNADDSLCVSLGKDTGREAVYFGIDNGAHTCTEDAESSDAAFCIYCKEKYDYTYRVYGHLGGFYCPRCDYKRPDAAVKCTEVEELTGSYSSIHVITEGDDKYPAKINLPGLYNVYNALAALACGQALGLPAGNSIKALGNFECGFGRMETINVDDKAIRLILVKNPTGFNQVINYLLTAGDNIQLAIVINDKLADGTDVSWLWDVDFEKLGMMRNRLDNVYVSGIRGEDMAVRLKYAGMDAGRISIIKDYGLLLDKGLSETKSGHSFYILPTYTAMLDIRKVLKKRFKLKDFWK